MATNDGRCGNCGYESRAAGAGWGYVAGPVRSDACEHAPALRYCPSCQENWWRVGLAPVRSIIGPAQEECPACAAASSGTRTRLTLSPLVAAPPSETISALAAAVVRAYEREHAWDDMSAEDVTVCARFNGTRAAL